MTPWLRIFSFCGLFFALVGCEAPIPSAPPAEVTPSSKASWAQWLEIADAPPAQRDIERAVLLTSTMAKTPEGLTPMVAYLGDPSVDAEKRIVAIICLSTQQSELAAFESTLSSWTEPEQDEQTRKLATHVLGLLDTPDALKRMSLLLDDSARPVREAAMGVMLSFHPERVQDRIEAYWDDPETSVMSREQVITGMPPELIKPFIRLYGDAATDLRLTSMVRLKSINVLGQLGTQEHIAILRRCVDNDPDDEVKEQARGALALLEATSGPLPAPVEQRTVDATQPSPSGPPV